MKNASIHRITITYWLLLLGFCSAAGQSKLLNIEPIGQKTNSWCWAASIEMIMKFHNPASTITQCMLAKRYRVDLFNSSTTTDCGLTCNGDCESAPNPCTSDFNYKISFAFQRDRGYERGGYFDMLMSLYGYHSMEKINIASNIIAWERIKKEIDNCRPFILAIRPKASGNSAAGSDPNNPGGDHLVVVKGYYDVTNSGTVAGPRKQFLITSDPWSPCEGHESLFPYSVFSAPGTLYTFPEDSYGIYSVYSMVHQIYPDSINLDTCNSCDIIEPLYTKLGTPHEVPIPDYLEDVIDGQNFRTFNDKKDTLKYTNNLINTVVQNADKVIGFNQNQLKEANYQELMRTGNYYDARIHLIRYEDTKTRGLFNKIFNITPNLSQMINSKQEIIETVSASVSPDIVSTFHRATDGTLVLRKISNKTSVKSNVTVKINQSSFNLSNNTPGAKRYEIIRYLSSQYEFYSFKIENNDRFYYLAPVKDYPNLSIQKGVAYREKDIIKKIRVETDAIIDVNILNDKPLYRK